MLLHELKSSNALERNIASSQIALLALLRGRTRGSHFRVAAAPQPRSSRQFRRPWTAAQTVEPAGFAKELSATTSDTKPTIVCVGFHALYEGAHIPGASFHGAASTAQGLDNLKDWAKPLPRDANIVLYCGCCPLAHCPNIRPAFLALRDMGFTHLRVLILPNDFNTDWIAKGYPVEKPTIVDRMTTSPPLFRIRPIYDRIIYGIRG